MKKPTLLCSIFVFALFSSSCSDEQLDPNAVFDGFEITGQMEGVPFNFEMTGLGGRGVSLTNLEAVSSRFYDTNGTNPNDAVIFDDILSVDFWLPNPRTDLLILSNLSSGDQAFFQWDNPIEGVSISFNEYETTGKVSPQNIFQIDTTYLAEKVLYGELEEVVVVEGKFDCFLYSYIDAADSLRINATFRSFIDNTQSF